MKDVTPKLRQKHWLASLKKNTETTATHRNSDGETDAKNGNTTLTQNSKDHNFINKSLHFQIADCHALPIIVVEIHRDKKSKQPVEGPSGKQGDPKCLSNTRDD